MLNIGINAQDVNLAIGQWRTHLPYQAGPFVTQSNDKVYYSTEGAVLAIDKVEQSLEFLDKVSGLSNTGIRLLKFHQAANTLIVVYDDSAIEAPTGNDKAHPKSWESWEIVLLLQLKQSVSTQGGLSIALQLTATTVRDPNSSKSASL